MAEDLGVSDAQIEVLSGAINIYSLVGALLAGWTSDRLGRRLTIVLTNGFFLAGPLVMSLAGGYAALMAGRLVAGIGVGYALVIAPVYTAEVSPASSRGFLTSFPEVFINFGILLGYVSNYAFSRLRLQLGWRLMLGVGAAPSVALALMVLAMPESPRWLVMKGRLADAKVVLGETSDTAEEAATRLAEIKEAVAIPADLDGDVVAVPKRAGGERRVWKELILSPTPAVRRVLLSALGIHFFQQSSGIDAVVLYSPRVFQSAGITDKNKLLGTTCAVGVTKTLFILVATFTLDRFGRRPLLLASAGGMIATLVTLGLGLTVIGEDATGGGWAIAVSIASILAFVAFFSIGLGPITWVYSSEIFPLHLRALGCALGVGLNRVTSGVISMTFLSLSKAITIGGSSADGDGAGERQEGHGDDAAGDAVARHGDREAQRARPQREDLRGVHAGHGPEADGEEGDVGQDGRDAQADGPAGHLGVRAAAHDGEPRREADEGEDHPARAGQQQRPPAGAVEQERGDQDEDRLGDADGAGGAQELVVAGDARALEHARAVEHDGVDARRLLEEVEADRREHDSPHGRGRGHDELPPNLPLLAASLLGHGDHVAVEVVWDASRRLDVSEPLRRLLRRVSDLLQHSLGVGEATLHDKPPWRLRHAEHHEREQHGWRRADAEHDAPPEGERQARESIVGDVAEEDTEVDGDLRERREEATRRRRRDLGRVHGRDHDRVPHADARHEAADHESGVVTGEPHE